MGMIRRRLAGMANDGDSPWVIMHPMSNVEPIIKRWTYISRAWYYDTGVEISSSDYFEIKYLDTDVKIGIEWAESPDMALEKVFEGCSVVEVSPSLFTPIIENIRTLYGVFMMTTMQGKLRSIPVNLFQGLTQVSNFGSCFLGQSKLTGSTPIVDGKKLWERFPEALGDNCFSLCKNLDDYDSIPASWK